MMPTAEQEIELLKLQLKKLEKRTASIGFIAASLASINVRISILLSSEASSPEEVETAFTEVSERVQELHTRASQILEES